MLQCYALYLEHFSAFQIISMFASDTLGSANWYWLTDKPLSRQEIIKRLQKSEFNAELNYMAGDEKNQTCRWGGKI